MTHHNGQAPDQAGIGAPIAKIKHAFLAYRVLAWVTGIMLLILTTLVIFQIIHHYNPSLSWPDWLSNIPPIHGWCYLAYLIACTNLAILLHWPLTKTIHTLLAGTIPFYSFFMEHTRSREIKNQLATAD